MHTLDAVMFPEIFVALHQALCRCWCRSQLAPIALIR